MSASDFEIITIEFPDESRQEHDITRCLVQDGVLHLFYRNGQLADEQHVASYPIANLHRWTRRKKHLW